MISLTKAREMADRNEPLPEDFYIDATGEVQWKPGRPIPADYIRYPGGCPDPDWCSGNRVCYWDCRVAVSLPDDGS